MRMSITSLKEHCRWCPKPDSNRHVLRTRDFKSLMCYQFHHSGTFGGSGEIRTHGQYLPTSDFKSGALSRTLPHFHKRHCVKLQYPTPHSSWPAFSLDVHLKRTGHIEESNVLKVTPQQCVSQEIASVRTISHDDNYSVRFYELTARRYSVSPQLRKHGGAL